MKKEFSQLPKKYFFDKYTKNLVLAYFNISETEIWHNNNKIIIPANTYVFQDLNGNIICMKQEEFEKRFTITDHRYGLFQCEDIEKTVLNLIILRKELIGMSMPEENEILLTLKKGLQFKIVYEEKEKAMKNFKEIKHFLSLANKTIF